MNFHFVQDLVRDEVFLKPDGPGDGAELPEGYHLNGKEEEAYAGGSF